MEISDEACGQIVRRIAHDFDEHVALYDQKKYPPTELGRLRRAFSDPDRVTEADILAALIWKYGHTGKQNFPKTPGIGRHRHQAMAGSRDSRRRATRSGV